MQKGYWQTEAVYRWAMVVIVLVAFGVRLFRLDGQSLRGDEAASATYASLPLNRIVEISRATDPHPPLFYATLHLWEQVAGVSAFAVRLWAVWPGVLAVVLLAALVKRLAGRRAALLGALLLAVNSFHSWHAQDARSYTWLVAWGLFASILVWRRFTQPAASRREAGRHWLGYGLTLIPLVYLHYYAVFLLAFHGAFGLWLAVARRRRAELLGWGAAVAGAGLALLPWLKTSWAFVSGFTGDFAPAAPLDVLTRVAVAFSGGLTGDGVVWLWAVVPLVLPAMAGAAALWAKNRAGAWFLLAYLLVPLAGVMLLTLRGQAFTERYLILAQPPYLVFLAVGLARLGRGGPRWRAAAMGAVLLWAIGLNGMALSADHFHPDRAKSPQWRQAIDFLLARQQAETDIILYNFPEAAVTYYLDTANPLPAEARAPVFLMPFQPNPDAADFNRQMLDLLADYRRVWFVPVNARGWDDGKLVETWLARHAAPVLQADFHWARVAGYLTPAGLAAEMTAQPVMFEQGVALRGFRVDNKMSTNTIQLSPGDDLTVNLVWVADGPTTEPLTIFVQLIDPTGFLRAGYDNPPVGGTYPTTAWQAGEQIVDSYHLSLPAETPPGRYQVWVGLYNPQTGARVPVPDAAGQPTADHVVLDISVEVE